MHSFNFFHIFYIFFSLTTCLYGFEGTSPHHTTAFIDEINRTKILTSYSYYTTNCFWDNNSVKHSSYNKFASNNYRLYAEYALSDKQSLFMDEGYLAVNEELNRARLGLSDLQLGWKRNILNDEISAFTGQLIVVIPTGDYKSTIRQGSFGVQASLLYSSELEIMGITGWTDLSLDALYVIKSEAKQIKTSATIGCNTGAKIQWIGTMYFDTWFEGVKIAHINLHHSHFQSSLLKAQFECRIQYLPFASLSVGAYKHLWGKNVGSGGGVFGGTWFYF